MSRALIVVDVQKSFVEGGSLPVEGGLEVAHKVRDHINNFRRDYKKILATKDWHSRVGTNNNHFSDEPDYVDTWPQHCVANSTGSEFAGSLDGLMFDDIFHKGWNEPAYSGFQGYSVRDTNVSLHEYLQNYGLQELDIVGIASTHCVLKTVEDALDRDYTVQVLSGMTVGVGGQKAHNLAIEQMFSAGAVIK